MKHDWNAIRLGSPIDDFQLLHASQVVVGKQQLVWRMNFDHPYSKFQKLLDIRQNVVGVTRMQAPTGDKPLRIFFGVVRDELIHSRCKPDDFRSDIVDKNSPVNASLVEVFKKSFR